MNAAAQHTLDTPQAVVQWLHARKVQQLCADSRAVETGDAFVAWPGYATDARAFVAGAFSKGAVAALVEARDAANSALPVALLDDARVALVSGLKTMCGDIASLFYQQPSGQLNVVAVTGTNGKTSTTWWLAQALSAAGQDCGLVGTLGVGSMRNLAQTGLTTPDPIRLQQTLRSLVDQGVAACAIEASSIGLAEARMAGTAVRVAVFTNLSQDHLDYHANMDNYWQAKRALFNWPGLQAAVVNIDDAHGAALAQELAGQLDVWTIGLAAQNGVVQQPRLIGHNIRATPTGTAFDVSEYKDAQLLETHSLDLPIVGNYNVSNMLGVLASMRALGIDLAAACASSHNLEAVPGRMQLVDVGRSDISVLVDYAHTPDALVQALQAVRPMVQGNGQRLWCVMGCGGDRDTGKRAPMAQAALDYADAVVFTSDNPRTEEPQTIVDQLMSAALAHDPASSKTVLQQVDRAQAIATAVAKANRGDVLLIAGKGHEDYQEIAGVRMPFSDVQVASAALRSLRPTGGLQ
ncbi:UDP-N-acetylmuramoyl-L-alanyl-D-glutamate--2,6-diaminopimelate ligase [Comamonadaceae bacterium M7527]|nr:UDP-N-acetylmuramoyl-L-alanyl-D-glutamate--2,6-diaminopimelate ligase [Comamonadaceae bacterium M7527]